MKDMHQPVVLNFASWHAALGMGRMLAMLTAMVALVGCDTSRSSGGYEASVEILVVPREGPPDLPEANSSDVDFLATHIQIIQSPRVIAEAVEKGNLRELPSMAELVASEQNLAACIRENIRVEQIRDGALMRVRYSGPDEEGCVKVLEAVVLAYQAFLGETFTGTSEELVALIEQTLSELGTQLVAAEADYFEFRQQAELGPNVGAAAQERLKALEGALTEIDVERAKSEARLDVLEEALVETAPGPDEALSRERDNLKVELRILEKQHQKLADMAAKAGEKVKRLAIFELQDGQKVEELEQLRERHDTVIAKLSDINLTKAYGGFFTEIVSPIEVRQR